MIYYAEDDESIRELVLYSLRGAGYEALGFADGGALLSAVAERVPQLVLLDIMLPETDGMEVLRRLRKLPATRRVPVIMITARGSEYDRVKGLDEGADDYIVKPFGIMELISRVKALLRRTYELSGDVISVGPVEINVRKHSLTS